MSDWEIALPFRDRDAKLDLGEIADDVAESITDPEEQAVTRALGMELVLDPDVRTYGDALDKLDALGADGRRALLDRAREGAGLPRIAVVEGRRQVEFASRPRPTQLRDGSGRCQALCSEPGCPNFEPGPLGPGSIKWVDCRRWFCAAHREGHEEEMQPYTGAKFRMSMSGVIQPVDEAEEADRHRAERQAESRRREREADQARRRRDAERLAAYERAAAERMRSEHPRGLRPEGIRP